MTVETQLLFEVVARDPGSKARVGRLRTRRGVIETPVFMPVATQATVKTISSEELKGAGATALLSNSYHLSLRPGELLVGKAGGLHRFMNWDGAILTDSGGFQVFSLAAFRKLSEEGVSFRSHIDGSERMFTPESVIAIQDALDSDMWTCLDHLPHGKSGEAEAERALRQTQRWSRRALASYKEAMARRESKTLLFGIAQGAIYPHLRKQAVEDLLEQGFQCLALGGFSVGEEKQALWDTLQATTEHIPAGVPTYLMGMGDAPDLWEAVARGVDMMDCVWPTRIARHGLVMTLDGRLQIKNARFREDFGPIEAGCDCLACRGYSRAYLGHLYRAEEGLAARLLSLHNIRFLIRLTAVIKENIRAGTFVSARKAFLERYQNRNLPD